MKTAASQRIAALAQYGKCGWVCSGPRCGGPKCRSRRAALSFSGNSKCILYVKMTMGYHCDMALSQDEREKFLAEPHTGALSVDGGTSRGPLTVPIWYQYTPGGEPWVLTGAGTRKAIAIEAAGYFSLMVQRMEPTRRYAAVDGSVNRIEPATDDDLVNLTYRYLDGDAAERHLDFLRNRGEHLAISMRPEHWFSADKGGF